MRGARRCAALLVVFAVGLPQLALAQDCDHDLADAHQLIAAIQARDPQMDELVKKRDIKGACVLLRDNLKDMTTARDNMDRCLTGFDHNEEVSELNANLADLNDAISAHCR
jgi:hypothetical protein